MIDSVKKRTADRANTLAGRYYSSAEVYGLETKNIFLKRWIYVGRASSITEPGEYFLVELDTENVIVLRDHDGTVRAFHNTCRHRGTRLCEARRGKFAKSLQCSYHAWTYGLDGKLIGAPHMEDVEGFDKRDFSLKSVPVGIWDGCVFVNFDIDAAPLHEVYAPLSGKFDAWRLGELEVVHQVVYDIDANWKLVVQNYSECYHCPSLHPVLNKLTPYKDSSNDLERGPFLGGPMRLSDPNGSMTMSGRVCATRFADLPAADKGLVYYYTLFPNMLLSLFPDYVVIHRLERIAVARTRIVCDWLFHPTAVTAADFDASDAIEFWSMTNEQDWKVSELSQLGVTSRAYEPGPYSELESMIAAWDREYLSSLQS